MDPISLLGIAVIVLLIAALGALPSMTLATLGGVGARAVYCGSGTRWYHEVVLAVVAVANRTTSRLRIAACEQRSLASVQEIVVRLILACDEILRAVVAAILVDVVHDGTCRHGVSQRRFNNDDVLKNLSGLTSARIAWRLHPNVSVPSHSASVLASCVVAADKALMLSLHESAILSRLSDRQRRLPASALT